jgi:hypothetical protein
MGATSIFFAYNQMTFCWRLSLDSHRVCDTWNKTFARNLFLWERTPVLLCHDYGNARMTEKVLKQVFFERASPERVSPETVYPVIGRLRYLSFSPKKAIAAALFQEEMQHPHQIGLAGRKYYDPRVGSSESVSFH